jgi:signal transduction histidine kinase
MTGVAERAEPRAQDGKDAIIGGRAGALAKQIARSVLLGVIYIVFTKLGLKFAQITPSSTAVWPGTGIAIAGTLLFGYETAPVWLISAFITNVTTQGSVLPSFGIAAGNTLEAMAGAWLIRRFAGAAAAFDAPATAFAAVGCLALAAALSATVGIASLQPWAQIASGRHPWFVWWWGDLTGAVLILPCVLSWSQWDRRLPSKRVLAEIALFAVLTAGLCALVFLPTETYSLIFLIIFVLAWAALRLGRRVTMSTILLIACFAAMTTANGRGPFTHGGRDYALIIMQLFFGSLAITKLLIANTVEQRQIATRARELFISATLHELRSPLTTVHGGLQVLARRLQPGDSSRDLVVNILAQSRRLVDATNNLSEARAPVFCESSQSIVDLGDVIARAVKNREIYDNQVYLLTKDSACTVRGDATRLEQVVTNLLDNAQKYGGDKPRQVSLRHEALSEQAVLSVTDFGIGIPAEELGQIFVPYYRAGAANESGHIGAGLGLHVVKVIVESHGGSVRVESVAVKGSTFEVRLPLALEPAPG